jgi:Zn finger protein HypA/HybF involved in hydrogenase expression
MNADLDWLNAMIDKIKVPAKGIITCTRCKKVVQSENGLLFCDCHDERKGIDQNDPSVVLLDLEL